ncbi:ABC transporter ATP-binding protein [Desulforhopalus vacuolatus]|uniref:ABC transporter ATP-binding protein n=1 Tax=Desulforhopalus vacuolatus TaxID=40414 RepID=UPI001965F78F|nr:ABC transporter ATP-binding protein [Desulforhopalus vacuolatus]MBM9518240.1 ABC transporter ATP-binding protein [Desulforhopalus vacuolatus]
MTTLKIEDLHKTYKGGFEALKGVNLEVDEGDFFGLLGPNGAGKTTIIGIITSLVTKTSGRVEVFGIDIDRDFPAAKRMLGVVPQEFNFSQFEKVIDIVIQQAGYYGLKREEALSRAEIYLKRLSLWDKRDNQARQLSGGMKRRLMIARGLIHEPKLLILDEPTAGVDVELRRGMWEFLEELSAEGRTIILTTHYLEEAEQLCNKIGIINGGRIIASSSTRDLLHKLNHEVLLFESREPLPEIPALGGIPFVRLHDTRVEFNKPKELSLNEIFSHFSANAVIIDSMRNKSNRLEELFLEMVKH